MNRRMTKSALPLMIAAALLSGCSDDDDGISEVVTDPERLQDAREFSVDPATVAFEPLEGTNTDAWYGVMEESGAGYQIEVPANWNGALVMYAHGYRGEGEELTVSPPRIREWLIEQGYAWAASSYSTNYYDVRTGVEDTNELALRFNEIAEANGRMLAQPSKIYITGHSMGGHVTAAAIEDETYSTANNKVRYDGAVPMCGVLADTLQFDYLQDFTFAAQHVAGMGPTDYPAEDFDAEAINDELWHTVPSFQQQGEPTEKGLLLESIIENLSGGERPMFEQGFRGGYYNIVMGTGGRDGTINGILAEDLTGNADTVYQFDSDPTVSPEEQNFNNTIFRVEGNPAANAPRNDGLRWVPVVNGEFNIPVVAIHGLGDLYVPFLHEQEYYRRAEANGSSDMLVQRAIRAPGHCDFTNEEEVAAFRDMVNWEMNGIKPAGEVSVIDPDVISDENYGCQFSMGEEHTQGCPLN